MHGSSALLSGFRDFQVITDGTWGRHNTISYTALLHEIPRRAIIYSRLNHGLSAYGRSVGTPIVACWPIGTGVEAIAGIACRVVVDQMKTPAKALEHVGLQMPRVSSTRVHDTIAILSRYRIEIRNPHRVQSSQPSCFDRHLLWELA